MEECDYYGGNMEKKGLAELFDRAAVGVGPNEQQIAQ